MASTQENRSRYLPSSVLEHRTSESTLTPSSRRIQRAAQQLAECIPQPLLEQFLTPLVLFNEATLSDDAQQFILALEGAQHIAVDMQKLSKIIELLSRAKLLLPPHARLYSQAALAFTQTERDPLTECQTLEEELEIIHQFDLVLTGDTASPEHRQRFFCTLHATSSNQPAVIPCQVEIEIRLSPAYPQHGSEPPMEVEIIRSSGLTTSQEGTLQLLVDLKQELRVEASLLATLMFIQEFLQSIRKSQEDQLEERQAALMEIPFLPPLHTLNTVQMHTKTLPYNSVSLLQVQEELTRLARASIHRQGLQLLGVEDILQPAQLDAFIAYTRTLHERKKPVKAVTMGFHGASRETLESIVEFGLLSAGEFTREGRFIHEQHGAKYGQGIYVSPHLNKAIQYAYPEGSDSLRQVLVSLVSLGNALQCEEPYYWDPEYSRWYPRYEKKQDGYDSHIAREQNEFTLFDSHQVLPVLLLTLGPSGARSESAHRQVERNKKDIIPSSVPAKPHQLTARAKAKAKKAKKASMGPIKIEQEERVPVLPFYKVPGSQDEYIIQFPHQAIEKLAYSRVQRSKVHLITLIPQSKQTGKKSFGRYVLPACADIYQTLQPDLCSAVFISKTPEKVTKVTSAAYFKDPSTMERPMATEFDILGAYELALDIALASHRRAQLKDTPERVLFVFVMFVNDKDTQNTPDQFGKGTRSAELIIKANQLQCVFRTVTVGRQPPGLDDAVQLGLSTDTIHSVWYPSVYEAHGASDLPLASANLVKDLRRLIGDYGNGYEVCLPFSTSPFDGFLSSLGAPPTCQCRLLLEEGDDTAVLYRGIPPQILYLSFLGHAKLLPATLDRDSVPFLLSTLKRLILELKVAVLARRKVDKSLAMLRSILAAIKQEFMGAQFFLLSTQEKATRVKQLRDLVSQVETQLNSVENEILLMQSGNRSDTLARWLTSVDTMKHGANALRRVERAGTSVSPRIILKDLDDLAKTPADESASQTPSVLSGWTASEHWEQIRTELKQELEDITISELLYSMGMTGLAIHVVRSESAMINPWNLIVEYVSAQRTDSASAMALLDLDLPHHDDTQRLAEDVLVVPDACQPQCAKLFHRSKLYKAYLAVVFTRNYDLVIPGQHVALTMISFVKSIEQLMNPELRTPSHLQGIFEMYLHLRNYVTLPSVVEYWKGLTDKLFLPRPGLYLTEAEEDDVVSVVKVLAPLCFSDACDRLFTDKSLFPQLCDVALALLAEVTSRSCRVLVRQEGLYRQASPLIRQALGISAENTTIPPWQTPEEYQAGINDWSFSADFSEARGKKYSSRLFVKKWVNCSPQAVVACLGFARLLHRFPDKSNITAMMRRGDTEELFSYFMDGFKQVTMRNFIVEYVPTVNPMHLQIAMYVQGLAYHSSKDRKAGLPSLLDPLKVTQDIAREERKAIVIEHMNKQFQQMRQELRRARLLEAQKRFFATHSGLPTLFTWSTVGEMNSTRPTTDQLVLEETSGLLRHHCCFPNCPKYLTNFATPDDIQKGTRNGIMRHLSPSVVPRRVYFRNFHSVAKSAIRASQNEEEFAKKVEQGVTGGARLHERQYFTYLVQCYWRQEHGQPLPTNPWEH